MKPWQLLLLGILFGLLAAGLVLLVATRPPQSPVLVIHPTQNSVILVNVDGAVAKPGVYEIPAGSRINEAATAAGGLLASADTTSVNLAEILTDGEKVMIMPLVTPSVENEVTPAATELVNLNTATVELLDTLPGIGPAKAAAIVEYRQKYGNFSDISDLLYVPGIGQSILDSLYNYVTVNP